MPSANFDELHLRLARKIFDYPSTAVPPGTGVKVSAALRTDYLNRANKQIQFMVWTAGKAKVNEYLRGLVKTAPVTMASGSGILPVDFSFRLSFQKASGKRFDWVEPERKADLDINANPNQTSAYTILGNLIYAYEDGAAIADGDHVLYYIGSDQRSHADDDDDIAIDALWYEVLVDLAAAYHFEDRMEFEMANAQLSRVRIFTQSILGA